MAEFLATVTSLYSEENWVYCGHIDFSKDVKGGYGCAEIYNYFPCEFTKFVDNFDHTVYFVFFKFVGFFKVFFI